MDTGLKRKALRGVGWALLSSISVRALQAVTTLVLAKLLIPSDFGAFALSSLILNAINLFRDMGLGQVLIYRQSDISKTIDTAFWLSVGSSILAALALAFGSRSLAELLNVPVLAQSIRVMSIALVISGTANIHLALLDKDIRFRTRALPEVAGTLAYAATSIGLAAAGFGVWSMVIGWIMMALSNALLAWLVSPWRPRFSLDISEARGILSYGKPLMLASAAVYTFHQIDNAAIGKWLGPSALGFYSLAFTVCNIPATNLTNVANRVMFPTYSRLQCDLGEIRRAYLQTLRYIAVLAFPAAVGLILLSGPLISVLYGSKWAPAIPLFRILGVYGLVRSICATASPVFMAVGKPEMTRRISILQLTVATILVYPVTRRFGTQGVAVLFTLAYAMGTAYALHLIRQLLGIGMSAYLKSLWPSSVSGVLGSSAVWMVLRSHDHLSISMIVVSAALLACVSGISSAALDTHIRSRLFRVLSAQRTVR